MLRFRTAMSAIAILTATQFGFAQQRTETKSSAASESTVSRGSLVQQLRSLSDEALSELQDAERRAGVVAVQAHSPSSPSAVPGPPQPTGRAILRRTNDSPWLERFDQANGQRSQPISRTRGTTAPARATVPASQSSSEARHASVSRNNKPQQPKSQSQTKPAPTQFRFSDTTESPRQQSSKTPRLLLGDSTPTAGPVPLPIQSPGKNELAGPYPSQVEVLEQLPPSVRASLIGESDFDSSSRDEPLSQGQLSPTRLPPESLSSIDSMESEISSEISSEQAASPANRVAETNSKTTPLGQPPKVSRIPLPTRQDVRRDEAESTSELVEESTEPEKDSALSVASPQVESPDAERGPRLKDQATTFELETPKAASSPKPTALLSENDVSDDKDFAVSQDSNTPVPSQLASSPKVTRKPLPIPAIVTNGNNAEAKMPVMELESLPPVTLPSLPSTPSINEPIKPEVKVTQQKTSADTATRIRSNEGNRQSKDPSTSARIAMDSPRLKVTFEGPQTLPVNEPSAYNIIVHNSDVIPLHGIVVRMDVPAGVVTKTFQPTHGKMNVEKSTDGTTLLTWEFRSLAGSEMATAPLQFMAKESRNFPVAMEWTLIPMDASSQIEVLSPELKVALEGPAEVVFGQSNAYRLRVRNPGTAEAKAVKLRLTAGQYGASEIDLGSIAPGGEEVVEVDLTFNESGTINIAAVASLESNKSASSAIDVLVTQAELETSIRIPSVVYLGNATQVIIDLTNKGNADATDTLATVEIPAGCVVSKIPPESTLDRNRLICKVGKLGRGQSRSIDIAVDKMSEGDNEFRVSATNAAGLPAKFVAKTSVQAVTDLKLLVNDPIAPAPVGGEVVYELTLTNRGSKAADNVKVLAQFSEGIEPIKAEGHQFRLVPGQVLFDSIRRIEPGTTITLKVYAKADRNGMHRFRAEVRSDGSDLKLVQEESTQYLGDMSRTATTPTSNTPTTPLLR